MIAVVQRVCQASVFVENRLLAKIDKGLLVLLGIGRDEAQEDILWLTSKLVGLRIFNDEKGTMNVNIKDYGGDMMVVSQFTLCADIKKGMRPSYHKAAPAFEATPIYQQVVNALEKKMNKPVQTGQFGSYMKVDLINDGPVTIIIDTKNKG